ncbi:LytR/AlgR family response regulator transcription factor [Pseudomonas sp. CGJS7]|uniref:LytR/AlgR family response regulator transcription factor n=1 Tax=Pseudomonas sp. CGJS7 TaxID=3109348 RepID=UPI00300BBE60
MSALRVAIVDDEPLARARLRRLLQRVAGTQVEIVVECSDGTDVAAALARQPVDVLFLDIEMPETDGFAALAALPAPQPAIVFVTGYKQHAIRAFEVRATDYLLKPVSAARLLDTLQRIRQSRPPAAAVHAPAYPLRLALPIGQRLQLVGTDEIELVIAQRNYLEVQTADRSFVLRRTLSAFASELDPARFVQVHRSIIVRSAAVREVKPIESSRYRLTLASGKQVHSGRNYREAIRGLLRASEL